MTINAAILDGESIVINIIVLNDLSEHPGAIDAAGGAIGSTWDGTRFITPTPQLQVQPPVPQAVTRAQGKAALIQAGYWQGVLALVAAIEDETQQALAEVALHDTLEWQRNSPFLNAAAEGLGLTAEQLDALFVAAREIQL